MPSLHRLSRRCDWQGASDALTHLSLERPRAMRWVRALGGMGRSLTRELAGVGLDPARRSSHWFALAHRLGFLAGWLGFVR